MAQAYVRNTKMYVLTVAAVLAACDTDVTVPDVANSTPRAALAPPQRPPPLGGDSVVTPGGYRLRSDVHHVQEGHSLHVTGGHLQEVDDSGHIVADFGLYVDSGGSELFLPAHVRKRGGHVAGLGTGWIAYDGWDSSQPYICYDSVTWVVPAAPIVPGDGQQIFLFNGLQNSGAIFQPVLQWGTDGGDQGGAYWGAACYYAVGTSNYQYGSLITVYPGDVITGVISGAYGGQGYGYSYKCTLRTPRGNESFPIFNVDELTAAANTLEAYGIASCGDYPEEDSTAFQVDLIETSAGTPSPVPWTAWSAVTDCGQSADTVSTSNPNGVVDLYYGNILGINGATTAETTGTYTWGAATRANGTYAYQWQIGGQLVGNSSYQSIYLDGQYPSLDLQVIVTGGKADTAQTQVFWNPISSVYLFQQNPCSWVGSPIGPSGGTGGAPPYYYAWQMYEQGVGFTSHVDTTYNTSDTLVYYPLIYGDSYDLQLTVSDQFTNASNGGTGCN